MKERGVEGRVDGYLLCSLRRKAESATSADMLAVEYRSSSSSRRRLVGSMRRGISRDRSSN